MTKISVKGTEISVISVEDEDYISITDMLKAKDGDFFISDWLRNRNTVEFLGVWEKIYDPDFNYGEYAIIRSKSGLNNYKISVKEWVEKTNAIGLKATAGRYGGTYAHKDIAFEFGMWISAEFKIYLIKEFQRLKEQEHEQFGWDIKRNLAKINYKIHTDAIKENLIPKELTRQQINQIYANEADILNMALFGMTAKEWRDLNPNQKGNIRDYANVSQLVCLSNLENLNALFVNENLSQDKRLIKLNQIAIQQMKLLTENMTLKKLSYQNNKKFK
ncbi:MAG: DNA-binding protein [Candidatus Altiarchaeales archaeon HGW-Altiarchaeales-1]|nr:MAG: DNA-binding protein [Candidatus Altiarchaeales archaeon HGW-Altiarchaeales-2]PKP60149.1 MAG: DNA-binding protein [Candidatus Altiarchaeales archaeon HGW-Altiarchaeales-1]